MIFIDESGMSTVKAFFFEFFILKILFFLKAFFFHLCFRIYIEFDW